MAGGHTIDDYPPKYGLAVTGIVHPDRIIKNCVATPGEILILAKPIGTGAIVAGQRIGAVSPAHYQAALDSMKLLNNYNLKMLLVDAQTSGGLLLSCPPDQVSAIVRELQVCDYPSTAVIGEIEKKGDGLPAVIVD